MNVYGITGTNGKTTTTWVLAEFLKTLGRGGYVTTVDVQRCGSESHGMSLSSRNDRLALWCKGCR